MASSVNFFTRSNSDILKNRALEEVNKAQKRSKNVEMKIFPIFKIVPITKSVQKGCNGMIREYFDSKLDVDVEDSIVGRDRSVDATI